MAEVPGPEIFAPRNQRSPEQGIDGERIAFLSKQRGQVNPSDSPTSDNLNAVVRRITSVSTEEIDRVIRVLEGVRGMMRAEGERVSREIAGYASLSHSAVTAMKIMADSINEWKDGSNKASARDS